MCEINNKLKNKLVILFLSSIQFFFKMISIDAYRVTIGAFNNSSRQLNLRTICRGLTIGCHISSTGISKLLKPTRFVNLFILIAIFINCGDIETNPGPTFSIKTVHGSCHQANPKFGPTAGTQCMCNSLASLCYFKIKPLRFWTTSDIDIILDYGNAAYSRLGFVNEYLSFDDIVENVFIKSLQSCFYSSTYILAI